MNIVFLDTMTLGECDLTPIKQLGELICYPFTTPQECLQRSKDADIIITNKVVLNKEILKQLPKLKLVCIAATGMNNVDLQVAKECGIAVKNVAGYSTKSVVQHTITLALGLLSKISYYDQYVKSAEYTKSPIFVNLKYDAVDIDNKKWGIIGLGSIGKGVAKIAMALGASVSYYSTSGKNAQGYPSQSLESLLKESDIISIHAPLNEQTKGLIGEKELSLLKNKAIILNLGRGGIIDENALAQELKKREIYAGLDVFEVEPMQKNHCLLSKDIPQERLLLTPHIAWGYVNSRKHLIEGIAQNIRSIL
ncbi:hydroxyacid dehydrogenase [Helicobacter monodelphidis]|uniref:D-2-hydroxyacid dehydrogenase n=1 Tax=Helicobacter sp. 15-1451 TaxID=2004995 RepID=UPI000DCEDB6F|nr:D-2-hydroxyacid dehydrogenase [Helicobacter sp. 15-1451]RAX58960.1 hydroxyacid dehydrogenase [Helicobacter sp. 15-1451]